MTHLAAPNLTAVTSASSRTIIVRLLVVCLAFAIPMGFGVWDRLLSPASAARPTPTTTSGERLIVPNIRVPEDPSHAFTAMQPGSIEPVTFDPCRPIHYVVRSDGAPAESAALLTEAIARISGATGLQFIDDGVTTEAPQQARLSFQPERYGDRWAPVLIAWSNPAEYPDLAGPVIGVASNAPVDIDDGRLAFVSGQVVLDTDQISELIAFSGGRSLTAATLTHELAHLVGLAHVQDDRQLMYPSARPLVTNLAAGDLTGLAALGTGRCLPTL